MKETLIYCSTNPTTNELIWVFQKQTGWFGSVSDRDATAPSDEAEHIGPYESPIQCFRAIDAKILRWERLYGRSYS